ncbi:MAG: hypothetical protein WCF65_08175 [Parachlamydiaceae bacterium]
MDQIDQLIKDQLIKDKCRNDRGKFEFEEKVILDETARHLWSEY